MENRFSLDHFKGRLSVRLLLYVMACSLFFTLLAFAFQLFVSYRSNIEKIEQTYEFIEENYLPFITQSVYRMDEKQLELQFSGLLRFQDIDYVEIHDNATGFRYTVGDRDGRRDFSRSFQLSFPSSSGRKTNLGILTIFSSYQGVYDRLTKMAVVILFTTVIQIFPAAFFIFLIIQYSLTRHLTTMANYAKNLDIETLDSNLKLDRSESSLTRNDELSQVASAFNDLQIRIREDIVKRKKSEAENAMLASVIEQSHDNIIITDLEGKIEYTNSAFEQATGYSRTEVVGLMPNILQSGKHDKQFYRELWETIKNRRVWRGTITNKSKDGKLFHESATIFPVVNSENEIKSFAAVKHDITEKINLEEQLRQTQKMEAMGTLAGGIAHDFNNILGAIFAYTQLAERKLPKSAEFKIIEEYLSKVRAAGVRAKDLVDQIMTFSRKVELELNVIDLKPLIKETVKFLKASFPSSISISSTIDPNLDSVYGDYTQIHQVVMNLCTNASHAMEDAGGEIKIELVNFGIVTQSPETGNLEPGKYVMLSVLDTGAGIDDETQKRIFEPFFTTKQKGKGTGLGLSVVHGIINKHNGAIKVYSTPGLGTRFSVYIPASTTNAEVTEPEATYDLPSGSESILLVDDEAEIASAYADMLTMYGYHVKIVTESPKALDDILKNATAYDLVITDFTMPVMDGIRLSQEIKKLRPDLPIILTSGLAEAIAPEKIKMAGISKKLAKPIAFEDLLENVRAVLDRNE